MGIFTPLLHTYLAIGISDIFRLCRYMLTHSTRVAFANNLNPNAEGLPTWDEYRSSKQSLQIEAGATEMISDNFRQAGTE